MIVSRPYPLDSRSLTLAFNICTLQIKQESDLGVASRRRDRTGFGVSRVGSVSWSDIFRSESNAVERCTETEVPVRLAP